MQATQRSQQKRVIYLPITKLINNRVLTINNYNIVSVQFQVGSLFLMGIKYLWDVDTDVVAAA